MKALRYLTALVVTLGLVSLACAGDDQKKADKKAAKGKPVAGLVEKVDAAAKTITLKTGKKNDPNAATVTVTITDATKFMLQTADGEKEGKFTDVVAGKRVQVKKETKDGKEMAVGVMVIEGKKKKNG